MATDALVRIKPARVKGRVPSVLGSITSLGLSGVGVFVSAAELTQEGFAQFTLVLIVSTLVPLAFAWGVPDALVVGRLSATPRAGLPASGFILSSLLAMLGGLTAATVALVAGVEAPAAIAAALITAGWMALGFLQAVEQSHERYRALAKLGVLPSLLSLLGLLYLVAVDAVTVTSILWVRAVSVVVVVVIRLWVARARVFDGQPSLGSSFYLLRLGASFHVTALLAVAGSRLDQVLALRYFDTPTLAAYGLVLPVCAAVRVVVLAIGTVSFVEVIKASSTSVHRGTRELGLAAAVGAVTAGLAGSSLLLVNSLALDDEFELSPIAVALLVTGAVAVGVAELGIRLTRAGGVVATGIACRLMMMLGMVIFGPLLIPHGLTAAGLTTCIVGALGLSVLAALVSTRGRSSVDVA